MFCRVRQAGLSLKLEKCTFVSSLASYLEVEVCGEGISTNHQMVAAIHDWTTPKNAREVRSFLGLEGEYRQFYSFVF